MSASSPMHPHEMLPEEEDEEPWQIDPNHGMHVGPGFLGDSPHSLRLRELFRYYQPPPNINIIGSLGGGESTTHASPQLLSSHDPLLACLANLVTRTLAAKRCIITMTGTGLSYVIAESTQTLSLQHPHTHAPGDQLFLGAGCATPSIGQLCEHTISLLPPPPDSGEPFLLEIPDLRRHPKYRQAGYVRGWPHGRFYAGVPLRTRTGVSIGTMCVLDDRARVALSEAERVAMSELADVVMGYLETKRERDEGRKKQAAEIQLGRFIAEGFLGEEGGEDGSGAGGGMVERRDGRVWSAAGLGERGRREAERRRRVEERRAAFQERMFAEMVRREKEKEQKERWREEQAGEDSLRMRKDRGRRRLVEEVSMVEAEAEAAEEDRMAVDGGFSEPTPPPPVMRAHARPRRRQPGIIELHPSISSDEEPPLDDGLSLVDTIMLSPFPTRLRDSSSPPPSSGHSQRASSPSASLSTEATTASSTPPTHHTHNPDSGSPPPHPALTPSCPATQRLSNYESTVSVEPHFRATFSRAAALIRNGISANVVFLDPDLEGLFSGAGVVENDLSLASHPHAQLPRGASPETYISSSSARESAARARRPEWLRRCTGVLAHATSPSLSPGLYSNSDATATATAHNRRLGFDVTALDEATMAAIIAENRTAGGIVAFGSGQYPGLDDQVATRTRTEEVLPVFLPGVRNAIVVPLVGGGGGAAGGGGGNGDGVFAVAVVWTCESHRTFCEEVEGRFVVAVGRGIVAEVERLNVLSADKAKSEFISSISHELRTPLHGILASAEFMADVDATGPGAQLDPTQRSFVETITSCASTLLETVNHVLEFQKLSTPAVTPAAVADVAPSTPGNNGSFFAPHPPAPAPREGTDLAGIIQDVTEGACLGYSLRGGHPNAHRDIIPSPDAAGEVTVILDIPPAENWWFGSNRASLRRIVNNLVGNALKYNRAHGWVRVALALSPAPVPAGDGEKRTITLTVSDSGRGISREFLKTKLFTPFCQENPLSAGVGLGLSLVRQLVAVAGGRIDVTSQVGVGTTVVVEMVEGECAGAGVGGGDGEFHGVDGVVKGVVRGRKVGFVGFEGAAGGGDVGVGAGMLRDSLAAYAVGYYGMEIADDDDGTPDLLIAADVTSALAALQSRGEGEREVKVPVVALCTKPAGAGTEVAELLRAGRLTFLRKPFGPKRFTEALRAAMVQAPQITLSPVVDPPMTTTIPPLVPAPAPAPTPQIPPPSTTSKPTILAVEDNRINMLLLTTFLRKHAYPYTTATDGLEALTLFKAHPGRFDVILMDLQMPILSGTEATREIRALERRDPGMYLAGADKGAETATGKGGNKRRRPAYIVALTGLATGADRREAFEAGVDAFVVKPARFRELEGMWVDALGGGGEEGEGVKVD